MPDRSWHGQRPRDGRVIDQPRSSLRPTHPRPPSAEPRCSGSTSHQLSASEVSRLAGSRFLALDIGRSAVTLLSATIGGAGFLLLEGDSSDSAIGHNAGNPSQRKSTPPHCRRYGTEVIDPVEQISPLGRHVASFGAAHVVRAAEPGLGPLGTSRVRRDLKRRAHDKPATFASGFRAWSGGSGNGRDPEHRVSQKDGVRAAWLDRPAGNR